MHFCMCDFQLTGHPYTYVTAPDMLLRLFVGSDVQFALVYVTTCWFVCLFDLPPNCKQYLLVWFRYFTTWIAAFHALLVGLDIYHAKVPTANKISSHTVLVTHSSFLPGFERLKSEICWKSLIRPISVRCVEWAPSNRFWWNTLYDCILTDFELYDYTKVW